MLIAAAASTSVRAQVPNINASPPMVDAAAIADYEQAKHTLRDFQTESAAEFVKIRNYHELLVTEGRITHKFRTADGKLVHCIEIGSQRSVKNAGLNPKNIKLSPEVLPAENAIARPAVANPPNFGLDGTLDSDGNVRRCPEGSIPVLIPSLEDLYRFKKFQDLFRKYPASGDRISSAALNPVTETRPPPGPSTVEPFGASVIHEYAHAYSIIDNQGEQAYFNLWQPSVEQANEFSLSQLWVVRPTNAVPARQSVETGWQVFRNLYGDSRPHLFIYSTTHNYDVGYPGGYNLGAGLFVQTDSSVIIGGGFTNISATGGDQYSVPLMYYRDQGGSHDWWLKYDNTWVGYYPNSWYNSSGIADKNAVIDYGGEIINGDTGGVHTTTDMGSGQFPSEGWQHSAYTRHITYVDMTNVTRNATNLIPAVSDSSYYDLSLYSSGDPNWLNYFYFGGPGRVSGSNQIDDPTFFVTQHYGDFLNRAPDQSGLNFWVDQINSCNGNPQCVDIKRQNVSAAFFLSGEFKETGRYVIKLQRAAFGKMSIDSRRILFQQFLTDAQTVGAGYVDGQPGAEAILDQNKNVYTQSVVGSAGFVSRYPTSLPASAYVDALFATAGVTPTAAERQTAITAFGAGGTAGRTAALRKVTETSTLEDAEFRSAFVLMEYFGYLRRDPDQAGFTFWLNKLNQFNGNFIDSEMVKSFIVSGEYRDRFD